MDNTTTQLSVTLSFRSIFKPDNFILNKNNPAVLHIFHANHNTFLLTEYINFEDGYLYFTRYDFLQDPTNPFAAKVAQNQFSIQILNVKNAKDFVKKGIEENRSIFPLKGNLSDYKNNSFLVSKEEFDFFLKDVNQDIKKPPHFVLSGIFAKKKLSGDGQTALEWYIEKLNKHAGTTLKTETFFENLKTLRDNEFFPITSSSICLVM